MNKYPSFLQWVRNPVATWEQSGKPGTPNAPAKLRPEPNTVLIPTRNEAPVIGRIRGVLQA